MSLHDILVAGAGSGQALGVERIDVQTLADQACDVIERAILNGDLPPGTPLGEAELASRIGISRGPLREAINRLEGRRLLQRVPHMGVRVVCLSDAEVAEIYAMREVLEGLAARLAAEHMTPEEMDALEACAGFLHRKPAQTGPIATRRREDFHVRLAEGSRNKRLIDYLCTDMYSLLQLYRIRSGSTPLRAGSAEEHREIVAALRLRDGAAAEHLMRAHVVRSRDSLGLRASDVAETKTSSRNLGLDATKDEAGVAFIITPRCASLPTDS